MKVLIDYVAKETAMGSRIRFGNASFTLLNVIASKKPNELAA